MEQANQPANPTKQTNHLGSISAHQIEYRPGRIDRALSNCIRLQLSLRPCLQPIASCQRTLFCCRFVCLSAIQKEVNFEKRRLVVC